MWPLNDSSGGINDRNKEAKSMKPRWLAEIELAGH